MNTQDAKRSSNADERKHVAIAPKNEPIIVQRSLPPRPRRGRKPSRPTSDTSDPNEKRRFQSNLAQRAFGGRQAEYSAHLFQWTTERQLPRDRFDRDASHIKIERARADKWQRSAEESERKAVYWELKAKCWERYVSELQQAAAIKDQRSLHKQGQPANISREHQVRKAEILDITVEDTQRAYLSRDRENSKPPAPFTANNDQRAY